MTDKHLKLTPTDFHPSRMSSGETRAWWYEEPCGICIVVDKVGQFTIPWRQIRNALKRKDKP